MTRGDPAVNRARALVIAATVCSALAMAPQCGQPAQRMVLVPAEQTVGVGNSFVLTVETRALTGQTGFAFVLDYDPTLLALDGPIDLMHGAGELSIVPSPASGKVVVAAAQVTGLPDSTGTGLFLAAVPFRALAPGVATIAFDSGSTARAVVPSGGGPAVDAARVEPVKSGATVTIQ